MFFKFDTFGVEIYKFYVDVLLKIKLNIIV